MAHQGGDTNSRTLISSAIHMVHNTMSAFLKRANKQQLGMLIIAMVREAHGCLASFIDASCGDLDREESSTLAALITLHATKPDVLRLVALDFYKLTGKEIPDKLAEVVVEGDVNIVSGESQEQEEDAASPEKKKSGGLN